MITITIVCARCTLPNAVTERYCAACGLPLGALQPDAGAGTDALGPYEVPDPADPDVFEKIKAEMTVESYTRRLPALREAKHLVLTKYNMFIHLADAIMNDRRPRAKPRRIDLKPVSLDWGLSQ